MDMKKVKTFNGYQQKKAKQHCKYTWTEAEYNKQRENIILLLNFVFFVFRFRFFVRIE